MIPTKSDMNAAYEKVKPHVHRTPVLSSTLINQIVGAELFFKCENFQKAGAYKIRGATNAILSLTDAQKANGVVTHSSGNFAQAVALSAKKLGIHATIVMPENAPKTKKAAVKDYGGNIILCESTIQAREQAAQKIIDDTGAAFLHPSNDIKVIEGQGTACMELLEEVEDLDVVITPIGGGGLLAGTCTAIKHFSPKTEIYGSEPMGADDAWQSFHAGKIIPVKNPQTIADGLRTSLGDKNFPIIHALVKDIIRVEESEIIEALLLVWERMKIIIEPSSAVPLAAILKEKKKFQGKKIGIIVSGGNVDLKELPKHF